MQVSEATHADWKRVASERGVSMSEIARGLIEEAVLEETGGAARKDLVSRSHAGTAGGSLGDGADLAPASSPHAPVSSSAAALAASVPGVSIVRPHMKKHRPAVECPTRWPSGVCPDCGQTL